jgi:hypothetical protein
MKQASVQDRIQTGRAAIQEARRKTRAEKPLPPHRQIGEGVWEVQSATLFGVTYTCDLNEGRCNCDGYAWNLIKGGGKPCYHLRRLREKYGLAEEEDTREWPEVARQTPEFTGEKFVMPVKLQSTNLKVYDEGLRELFGDAPVVEAKTFTFEDVPVRAERLRKAA